MSPVKAVSAADAKRAAGRAVGGPRRGDPRRISLTLPPLHPGQQVVATHPARFKVLACGRRWGKTKLGALLCVVAGLEGKRAWWVAPSYKVANVGWRECKQLAKQVPGVVIRESDRRIEFPSGGWVEIRSASDPDDLRGEGLDLVVVDEFAFVKGNAWTEALRPALADRRGSAIIISTPKGFNLFWELYQLGQRPDFPEWASWTFPSLSNPYVNRDEIRLARATSPEHVYLQEYEARFLEAGGRQVQKRAWYAREVGTRYDASTLAGLPEPVARWVSWDSGYSESDDAAYTAAVTFDLLADYRLLVREVWRGRPDFPSLTALIEDHAAVWNYDGLLRGVIIEDKASGISALQTLRSTAPHWLNSLLIGFDPGTRGDKETRGHQAAVWGRNRCILLPEPNTGASWLFDFEAEFFNAPAAPQLDQWDAFNQGVLYLEHLVAAGWQARTAAAA